jgi:hypothetical protein
MKIPKTFNALAAFTTNRYLLAIVILAAVLRFGWVLYAQTIPGSDFTQYEVLAQRLARGDGYVDEFGEPTAFYAIGWPLFLSIFYRIFGTSLLVAGFINSVLGVAAVMLAYPISLKLLGHRSALIASALIAINPTLILYTSTHGTETLFIFQIMLVIWFVMRALDGQRNLDLIMIGVIAGSAILTRPVAVCVLVGAFAAIYVADRPNYRRATQKVVLIIIVSMVVVTPWFVRNVITLDSPTLQTSSGVVLWIGHNPDATGALMPPPPLPGLTAVATPGGGPDATETEINSAFTSAAIDALLANPVRAFTLIPRKMFELWAGHRHAVTHSTRISGRNFPDTLLKILPILTQGYLVLLLLLVVVAYAMNQPRKIWIKGFGITLSVTFVMWNLYHALNFGSGRYHVPVEPVLAIIAASAISALFVAVRSRASTR